MHHTLCTALFVLLANVLFSQNNESKLGYWLMGFNQTRFHKNWSLHSEIQYRSYEVLPNTEQLLLRGGINYHINSEHSVTAGYGRIHNHAFDKDANPGIQVSENRIWQQYLMLNNISRVFFQHRYRIEQRWLKTEHSSNYLNRFRYFLRVSVPINNAELKAKTLYLTLYDEIFIHIDEQPFDRNRLYGALGFRWTSMLSIEVGYLAQTTATTQHLLQTAVFYNIDFRKRDK
ncbi:MAG: DUF2490 domain-containing protein [Chitinophagales bacterium]